MTVHPLPFGDEGTRASREMLRRFDALAPELAEAAGPEPVERLRAALGALEALDRRYGGEAPLGVEGPEALVASALSGLSALAARLPDGGAGRAAVDEVVLAVGLWAIRHQVHIGAVEPVVNALAERSNRAGSRAELAAVYGLMQGLIAHVAPALGADLERSDPQRPWRVLHANLAITAIRTEDPDLMDHAFDALDRALPDEAGGFYAEALALALAPGIAPTVRARIEARHRRTTGGGEPL